MQKFYDYASAHGINLPADLDGLRFTDHELWRIYNTFIDPEVVCPTGESQLRSEPIHAGYWLPCLREPHFRAQVDVMLHPILYGKWFVDMHPGADPTLFIYEHPIRECYASSISDHMLPLIGNELIRHDTTGYSIDTADVRVRDKILSILNSRCTDLRRLIVDACVDINFVVPRSVEILSCWEIPKLSNVLEMVTCVQPYVPYPLKSKTTCCSEVEDCVSNQSIEVLSLLETCANVATQINANLPSEISELLNSKRKCDLCSNLLLTALFTRYVGDIVIGGHYCGSCRNRMRRMVSFGFHCERRGDYCVVDID